MKYFKNNNAIEDSVVLFGQIITLANSKRSKHWKCSNRKVNDCKFLSIIVFLCLHQILSFSHPPSHARLTKTLVSKDWNASLNIHTRRPFCINDLSRQLEKIISKFAVKDLKNAAIVWVTSSLPLLIENFPNHVNYFIENEDWNRLLSIHDFQDLVYFSQSTRCTPTQAKKMPTI